MKISCYSLIFLIVFSPTLAQTTSNNMCQKKAVEPWRELVESGRYDDALNILLDSIPKTKQKNKNSLHWHVGQLYACTDEYSAAIDHMKKSTSFFELLFDREWRLYYRGTIAFLNSDRKKLRNCYKKLWHKHSEYYYSNACRLKVMCEHSDKPYRLVYEMTCE